jgi:hypothetical protein
MVRHLIKEQPARLLFSKHHRAMLLVKAKRILNEAAAIGTFLLKGFCSLRGLGKRSVDRPFNELRGP